MRRRWTCCGAVMGLLLSVFTAAAQPRTATVNTVDTPPVIDGTLSESCWQRGPDFADLFALASDQPAAAQTEAWVCRDDAWLFFAVKCHDPNVEEIRTKQEARDDSIHRDDSVELFISPGTDGRTYYHFMATAANVQGDNRVEATKISIPWDTHWRSATRVDKDQKAWTVEMAIPLAGLYGNKGSGPWKFNLTRHKAHEPKELSTWAHLPARSFHSPAQFGTVSGLGDSGAGKVFAPVIVQARVGEMIDLPVRGYEVTVKVRNEGALPGAVKVHAVDIREDGQTETDPVTCELHPRHEQTVKVMMPIDEFVRRRSRAVIALEDAKGEWRFTSDLSFERKTTPLTVAMDRSYYTTETEGFLIVQLNLPEKVLTNSTINVSSPCLKQPIRTPIRYLAERVPMPVGALSPSTYEINVVLEAGSGKAIDEKQCTLVKRAPAAAGNEVKTDRWNRCVLLNGKPFFPHSFYGLTANNYEMGAAMGLNAALNWRSRSADDIMGMLEKARANGLVLFVSPISEFTNGGGRRLPTYKAIADALREKCRTDLPAAIAKIAAHPALLAWHMWDEAAGDDLRDALKVFYDSIHELDGHHPAMPGGFDILSPDPVWHSLLDAGFVHTYWKPPGPVDRVYKHNLDKLAECRNASREVMKPLWVGICGERHSITRRMMTPRERRLNSYLTFIYGGSGLFYFAWPVTHQSTADTVKELSHEIQVMTPALLRRPPEQTVTVEGGDDDMVKVALKAHPDGGGLLLVGNTLNSPVSATFLVQGLKDRSKVTRLFGRYRTKVRDGAFSDDLEAYATRAYRLKDLALPERGSVSIGLKLANAPAASTGAANLVTNPGFEQDDGWSGIGDRAPVMRDTAHVHSGEQALCIERTDATAMSVSVIGAPVTLKPRSRYRVGAWVRGEFSAAPPKWGGPDIRIVNETVAKKTVLMQSHCHLLSTWYNRSMVVETSDEPETLHFEFRGSKGKYVGTAWVDDVYVEDLGIVQSRNILPNSGFEHATLERYPDRWYGAPDTSLLSMDKLAPKDGALVLLDPADKMEGEVSCRIRGYQWFMTCPSRPARGVILKANTDYVFSAYMKSDTEDFEVWLRFPTGVERRKVPWDKQHRVGTEWQRVVSRFRTDNSRNLLHVIILPYAACKIKDPEKAPTLWIDAVQVEEGTEPTDYVPDVYDPTTMNWLSLERE